MSSPPARSVRERKFNEDLFYHLCLSLGAPATVRAGDDILILGRFYLKLFSEKHPRPAIPWAPDFGPALLAYFWPGNVRELRNTMEQLAAVPGANLTAATFRQCSNAVLTNRPEPITES
jgi:DNA-binding NtrC family response regulator